MGGKHLKDQAVLLQRDYIRKGQARIHIENAPDFSLLRGKEGKGMKGKEGKEEGKEE